MASRQSIVLSSGSNFDFDGVVFGLETDWASFWRISILLLGWEYIECSSKIVSVIKEVILYSFRLTWECLLRGVSRCNFHRLSVKSDSPGLLLSHEMFLVVWIFKVVILCVLSKAELFRTILSILSYVRWSKYFKVVFGPGGILLYREDLLLIVFVARFALF